MDLVLGPGRRRRADVAIANDPDADRLGAAIPQPDGSWRRLGGDEIGWLFADHLLAHTSGDDRLVITTLVSSSLLGDMAKAAGVHFAETFTGFKWIGRDDPRPSRAAVRARLRAGARVPRGAAARSTRTASRRRCCSPRSPPSAAAEGTTLQGRLDDIVARFGRHVIADRSVRMEPAGPPRGWSALRAEPARGARRGQGRRRRRRPGGRPAAVRPRRRRARPGPPERHRAEGEALRRSGRRRPRTPTSTPSPPSSSPPPPPNPDFHKQNRAIVRRFSRPRIVVPARLADSLPGCRRSA